MLLGVNIDHIAILREARQINDPNLIEAIGICKIAGADQITIHLREDRRHIQDKDVLDIIHHSPLPINLECSINKDIIDIVSNLKPNRATLVPENRQEVTTEGGLDIENNFEEIKSVINQLHKNQIETSLFIDPNKKNILLAKKLNVKWIELHTGEFANIYAMLYSNLKYTNHSIKELNLDRAVLEQKLKQSIKKLKKTAKFAKKHNIKIAAGHGLNYNNIKLIRKIKNIEELNIGQSIIARSVFVGLEKAIKDMKKLIDE